MDLLTMTVGELLDRIAVWQAILYWLIVSFLSGFFGALLRELRGGKGNR